MLQDVQHALRALRHSPTFTIVAVAVLTLAIGAGTAVFSVVDAVVLRGLPFDEHDRLAAVLEHDTKRATTFGSGSTTTQMFLDWRAQQQSFEAVTAVGSSRLEFKNEAGEPAEARSLRVTHEFFRVMRVAPLLGRAFTQQDEIDGRHRLVILSHGYWLRRFGGLPDAVGRVLEMNDQKWEVVGVMPAWFAYPVASDRPTDMYTPIAFREEDRVRSGSRNYNFNTLGRLKPGLTFAQANDDMNRLMAALDAQHPKWSPGRRARVVPLHEHLVGRVRSWMLMLLGAVALVLLIACANVANLMLARATVRGREIAIRAALGAGRWRLVRGLLVESLLLSLAAAALGIVCAWFGVQALRAWMPANVPRVTAITIDLRVLLAAAAAAVLTGLTFGVVPAFQASRPDLATSLKDAGRAATAGAGGQRLRSLLVVAEVALAVVLLVAAGLFIGSFTKLMAVDTGFDYRNVLTLDVGVRPDPKLTGRAVFDDMNRRGGPYVEQILAVVRAVPGVESAAAVQGGLPLTGSWSRNSVELPGRGALKGDDDSIDRRSVSPRYLETMRIPLRRGRYLNEGDGEGSDPAIVINEAAARKYWPGDDPLGKRIRINSKDWTVVGIVGDIRHLGPEIPPRQECYVPAAQAGYFGSATLVLRTSAQPLDSLPAVKTAIWSVNPEQRLRTETVTLEAYMDRLIAQRRFNMALLALFGLLGLAIAAAGLYGVMAYLVAQRTAEIGVRMALGATKWQVMSMVLRRAAVLTGAGILVGASVAWWFGGAIATFLFQIDPADPRIFAAALLTLALSGLVASAVPARRAASVDPMVALRQE